MVSVVSMGQKHLLRFLVLSYISSLATFLFGLFLCIAYIELNKTDAAKGGENTFTDFVEFFLFIISIGGMVGLFMGIPAVILGWVFGTYLIRRNDLRYPSWLVSGAVVGGFMYVTADIVMFGQIYLLCSILGMFYCCFFLRRMKAAVDKIPLLPSP